MAPSSSTPATSVSEADAARAVDAAVHRRLDQRAEILVRHRALVLAVAAAVEAVGHRLVLQVALAALVADRAVERMVDQQELHHAVARLLDHRRVGLDDHAVGRRHRAGGDRLGRLLHLDQAHAAIAGDRQALVVAEARDLDADLLAGLQHGGARRDLDLDTVDDQLRHCSTPPPGALPRPCTRRCGAPSPAGNGGSGPGSATPRHRPARRSCGPRPAA